MGNKLLYFLLKINLIITQVDSSFVVLIESIIKWHVLYEVLDRIQKKMFKLELLEHFQWWYVWNILKIKEKEKKRKIKKRGKMLYINFMHTCKLTIKLIILIFK